jgi:multiple sugar transport system substrate-binding protein
MRRYPKVAAVAAGTLLATLVTGCGGSGGGDDQSDGTVTVWTIETQPDRVAIQQEAMDAWAEEAGVEVELVPVEEDQVAQQVSAAALSGELPDALNALSPGLVRAFDRDGYLDHDAAEQVVEAVGEETFTESSLELSRDGDELIAVPADAWPMLVYYRKDLFAEAGLEPPTTYEALRTAAEQLTTANRSGITLATDAADPFTQQTLEFLAQGNGCELVDDEGAAALDSPECAETIELYAELAGPSSPTGTQGVESTRSTYFAGQAAMVVWSSFLLDELAGLVDEFTPSCQECTEPGWLAENTGVVSVVEGPSAGGEAGAYVELTSWAVTDGADPETADLVEHMMSDAFVDWLSMAPVGKVPVHTGTTESPAEYTDAWADLEMGVDDKAVISEVYPQEVIDTLAAAAESGRRWALPEHGDILGPITSELPLAKVAAELGAESVDAAQAQQQMQDAVSEIAERD